MNKAIKKIFSFTILFFFFCANVSANSINKVDMDIYLDLNGNTIVTETWDAYLTEGTEGYRPYTKLGNSSISNFSVSDESGKVYESLSYWDTSASFDSKAYKSGIHNITNGIELCFGISNYGYKTYTLKYDINNFVTQYTDTQGIYFNFLNLDQEVGSAIIRIHSDISFTLDNARIWAFGNNGTINFEDGSIVLDSKGSLSSNQYMVGLIRFENNLFNTSNKSSSSFDNIYDLAFREVNNSKTKKDNKKQLLLSLLYLIFNPTIWIVLLILLNRKKGKSWIWESGRYSGELNFKEHGKTLPHDNEINYYRDIPCNKDLERAYWVCLQYNIVNEKTLKQGLLGAILLKWIRNGYIKVSKTKQGLFSLKDNNYAIDFNKMEKADNELEEELFEIFLKAAGTNKILEINEFAKWSKKNYNEINSWFFSVKYNEQTYLEEQSLITERTEETQGMFGKTRTITIKDVNNKLREDAIQIKGLKKFLLDFSIMPEREYKEVSIWEEYLIFAELLGIADKVAEQFNKIYPDFNQKTLLNTDITTIAVISIAGICYENVEKGISKANRRDYSGNDRDSGGGGSSYLSGGSSSGGSSGGGFR